MINRTQHFAHSAPSFFITSWSSGGQNFKCHPIFHENIKKLFQSEKCSQNQRKWTKLVLGDVSDHSCLLLWHRNSVLDRQKILKPPQHYPMIKKAPKRTTASRGESQPAMVNTAAYYILFIHVSLLYWALLHQWIERVNTISATICLNTSTVAPELFYTVCLSHFHW